MSHSRQESLNVSSSVSQMSDSLKVLGEFD